MKAIRTLYGYGLNEAKQWAESPRSIIIETNDKSKAMEAINIFEGEYGIQVTINGKSKPKSLTEKEQRGKKLKNLTDIVLERHRRP